MYTFVEEKKIEFSDLEGCAMLLGEKKGEKRNPIRIPCKKFFSRCQKTYITFMNIQYIYRLQISI